MVGGLEETSCRWWWWWCVVHRSYRQFWSPTRGVWGLDAIGANVSGLSLVVSGGLRSPCVAARGISLAFREIPSPVTILKCCVTPGLSQSWGLCGEGLQWA